MISAHGSYVQEHSFVRPPVPRTSRRAVIANDLLEASGGMCCICGLRIYHGAATIDHVHPWARGGRNRGNRVPAHYACNQRKSDRLPTGCELIWLASDNARLGLAA
jgi:5-methylcytosine-specific restriction endonuclease McrA